jgi:hypothetical protein
VKLVQQIVEYPGSAPAEFDDDSFMFIRTEQDAMFDRALMHSASLFAASVSYVFKASN